MLVALLCLAFFAFGCGGNGSSGSSGEPPAVSTSAIDLPPGQTAVQLAWEPSEGNLDGYLTFRSDNDGPFEFVALVNDPTIEISGSPGDSVRLRVIALGVTGVYSPASPPSPPIRFHAAVEAVTFRALATSSPAALSVATTSQSEGTSAISDGAEPAESRASDGDARAGESTSGESSPSTETVPLDRELLDLLLRANARLPRLGLASHASQWIQTIVDERIAAGVSLVGVGNFDTDELRDVVWRDAAGQVFLSDGATLIQSDDPFATMTEALRLRPTETFVGLADFGLDGLGDWLIEDVATGDVWIIDGASEESIFAGPDPTAGPSQLVAHGDFDGDGRAELLWQHDDGSVSLSRPEGDVPLIEGSSDALERDEVLAVADLDGDGRDDVLARRADGQLEFGLSRPTSEGIRFEWTLGPDQTSEGLELLAVLDLDLDGTAEMAWLNGETLEIWDATTGPRP